MSQIATDKIIVYDESPNTSVLRYRAEILNHTPESLWKLWTTPDGIKSWWGALNAKLDLAVGGQYVFEWSRWILRGEYTEIVDAEKLVFTWRWDGENTTTRHVTLLFEAGEMNGGAVLIVEQGTYTADDAGERQSHIDGWTHFLPILAEQSPD